MSGRILALMTSKSDEPWLTVPNLLSLSRVALLPLWWWLMASPDRRLWWWGGGLIVYGIMTDVADGYLARRWRQVTQWGKIFDPVGDKIAAVVVGIFCMVHRDLPVLAFGLVTGRDVAMVVAGWVRYRRLGAVPTSVNVGRYAALLWGIVLLLYAFDLQPYARNATWPVVALYLLAGVVYWRRHSASPERI
ncbi:MAG: CDP-alcohol phosphatidyltransferase family protein [candidate division Zixibacteria bacterium]|nr:CDP-alcohol phosphatidyltransferase family protein [candidate division Zixibacteria bacterium]